MLGFALAWTCAAVAQPTDVHGPLPPTPSGDPADPVSVWAPSAGLAGEWSLSALGEFVDDPAVLYRQSGTVVEEFALVDAAVGLDLGARWAPAGPIALALSVPVFPYAVGDPDADEDRDAGPALGDLRLAVPLAIVPRPDREGFGLSAIPFVTLPTGARLRYLGDPGPSAGAVLAAGVRAGRVAVDANAGAEAGARVASEAQVVRGPLQLPVGLALGARLVEPAWLRVEARGAFDVLGGVLGAAPDEVGTPAVPFEVLGTLSVALGRGYGVLGAGRGVTDGIGAANVRVFAGAGYARLVERPGDEAVPEEPFRFRVADPRGVPVEGAEVRVGGELLGVTDGAGELAVAEPVRWSRGVEVVAARFRPVAVERPAGDALVLAVVLPWEPATVAATVVDVQGQPLDVTVTATSLDDPSAPPVSGRPGEIALLPGRYRVEISAPGMGKQVREIEVEPSGRPPLPIEAVLLEDQGGTGGTAIVVTDPEGRPVSGARVLVDGLPVGTTADGGVLSLGGLAAGPHTIEVLHEAFTATGPVEVAVGDATVDVPVPLQRVPGSVRIVVQGPNGVPVTDAVARFVGPRRLAPMALGERGERVQVLGAGDWTLVVTSARYGVQERDIVVPEGRYELITVEIVLQPPEAGDAELALRVMGPDGRPVEGVAVALDGKELGATSTGGTLTLSGLVAGPRTLAVQAAGLRPVEPIPLVLVPGLQERVLKVAWAEGTVDVVVRGPEGPVEDAQVRFVGDAAAVPAVAVGATGRTRTTVPPGAWVAQATSATLGLQERDVTIPPGSDVLHLVEFVLAPVEGGLAELSLRVVDPEGRPVEGAVVSLDGDPVGTTANAGTLRLSQLAMGRREVGVSASPYRLALTRVRLLEGGQEVEVALDWAPGAVKVRIHQGDEPVRDAIVRILGPRMLDPVPVDPATGEVLAQVEPGLWLVLATSPTLGIAEWDLEVKEGAGLSVVDLDLRPQAVDRTDLVVRVVDPDGEAVEHAKVSLDGAVAGETEQGGVVLTRGLLPGTAKLEITAPDFAPSGPMDLTLTAGLVERVVELRWVEIPVTVRTQREDGSPVDAVVQWVGPGDVDELRSGEDGAAEAMLRPGDWQVVATAGDLAGDARLKVGLADEPRPIELVLKPTRAVLQGEAVVIGEMVQFDFGQATLRPDSGAVLDEVARVLVALPNVVRLEVQGHTDTIGAIAVNQSLSQARAEAVVQALVARGVPQEKLVPVGYGPTRPIGANDTDEGRAKNRRVQFEIVERAAGG